MLVLIDLKLYGDNIFKKTGIDREGTGRHKKTRYFSGKQGISAGTGPRAGLGLLDKLRRERRRGRCSFFAPRTPQERRQRGRAYHSPGAGKALYIKAYKAGGPLHPPRKSQQQTKEGGLYGPW